MNYEKKFKVGNWVVYNRNDHSREIMQIYDIRDGRYYFNDNVHFSWSIKECDEKSRLWTIQDAKDGDVLAFYSEYKGNKMEQVGIIKKYVGKHGGCSNTFNIYVGVNWENNLQIGEYMGCSDIRPATKEQRDTLMKAISDAGYEWDFEKKELNKIEKKPTWSEEDEAGLSVAMWAIEQARAIAKNENDMGNLWYAERWLKSIKERMKGE